MNNHPRTTTTQNNNVDTDRYKLVELLDKIQPSNLGKISQANYVNKLSDKIQYLILQDGSNLVLIVQSIKDFKKACYKRDVLIEVLKNSVLSVKTLSLLLAKPFSSKSQLKPWKELANSLIAAPDLVANCGALANYPELKSDTYYSHLLSVLYIVLSEMSSNSRKDLSSTLSKCLEQRLFYSQLLGRIAISHCQLVWTKFTSRIMNEGGSDASGARLILTAIIESSSPSSSSSSLANTGMDKNPHHMGMFTEPLIAPILYNFKPRVCGGKLIRSILGTSIFHNEVLEYILCNKYLLQTNYWHSNIRQTMILFNIFSYLSALKCDQEQDAVQPPKNLLIETLLGVGDCWSDSTKVLLRPYEHSRYITCAFIVGVRYALLNDKPSLAKYAHKLQDSIIRGFPVYLNRASEKHRKLAMCLGEVVLAKLHKLMDEHQDQIAGCGNSGRTGKEEKSELSFDVHWDSDSLFMKNLLDCDIVGLFDDGTEEKEEEVVEVELVKTTSGRHDHHSPPPPHHGSTRGISQSLQAVSLRSSNNSKDNDELIDYVNSQLKLSANIQEDDTDASRHQSPIQAKVSLSSIPTKSHSSKRAVIELVNEDEDEDLEPYEMSEDEEGDGSLVDDNDEQDETAPIYMRDCIAGLAENKHPRYVRLCLIRAGALLEQKNNELAIFTSSTTAITDGVPSDRVATGTSISDIAVELAQLLLYLDDQYSINDFEAYRMKALSGLCAASPDLAVKYLLDEFNGTNRSIRHQLDILQALVISAEGLSERNNTTSTSTPTTTTRSKGATSTNGFVKYVSLYFYGIVYQLKADSSISILPSTHHHDNSYLLSRLLFSVSLIIKCVHQQPITCKLSNDLLDILAVYRNHPDVGVRKAIVSCLTVVKHCTPSVYFREYLYDKTISLFGKWLSQETTQLTRLLVD